MSGPRARARDVARVETPVPLDNENLREDLVVVDQLVVLALDEKIEVLRVEIARVRATWGDEKAQAILRQSKDVLLAMRRLKVGDPPMSAGDPSAAVMCEF